jgi:hypothetical protein
MGEYGGLLQDRQFVLRELVPESPSREKAASPCVISA